MSQWVETLTDPRERASALIPAIRGLVGSAGFLEAAELVRRHESDFANIPEEVGNRCLAPIIWGWVGSDLSAAKNWALQLPEGQFRDEAVGGLLISWSQQEPRGAAAFAAALPEGPIQQRGIRDALASWCAHDVRAAMEWTAALPAGGARDTAVRGVCDRLAVVRPTGEVQTRTAIAVVKQWIRSDPQSAAAWAAAFPEGQARDQAVTAVARAWASWDAQAAADGI